MAWQLLGSILPTFDWEPGPLLGDAGNALVIQLEPEYLASTRETICDVIFRREFTPTAIPFPLLSSSCDRAFSFFPQNLKPRIFKFDPLASGLDSRLSIRLEKPRSLYGSANSSAIAFVRPTEIRVWRWQ